MVFQQELRLEHERPIWLSIVIPAFNEEKRLPPTLLAIKDFLMQQGWAYIVEVIVADDGSSDETIAMALEIMKIWPRPPLDACQHSYARRPLLTILRLPHYGKGAAVRRGTLAARGEFVFICDADLSMPIGELLRFLPPLGPDCDIVIGSREMPGAKRIDEPFYRHAMGRVFNAFVQLFALRGIKDTQCGFKLLKCDAALQLCSQQQIAGFGFDVEWIALARVNGYSIAEIGIEWHHNHSSRVSPMRDTLAMIREVFHIRRIMRKTIKGQNDRSKDKDVEALSLEKTSKIARVTQHVDASAREIP